MIIITMIVMVIMIIMIIIIHSYDNSGCDLNDC